MLHCFRLILTVPPQGRRPHTPRPLLVGRLSLTNFRDGPASLSAPPKKTNVPFYATKSRGEPQIRISRSHGCTAKQFHPNGLFYPATSIRCDCCCPLRGALDRAQTGSQGRSLFAVPSFRRCMSASSLKLFVLLAITVILQLIPSSGSMPLQPTRPEAASNASPRSGGGGMASPERQRPLFGGAPGVVAMSSPGASQVTAFLISSRLVPVIDLSVAHVCARL